ITLAVTDHGGAGLTTTVSRSLAVIAVAPSVQIVNGPGLVTSGGVVTQIGLAALVTEPALDGLPAHQDGVAYLWSVKVTDGGTTTDVPVSPSPTAAAITFATTSTGQYVATVTVTDDDAPFPATTVSTSLVVIAP